MIASILKRAPQDVCVGAPPRPLRLDFPRRDVYARRPFSVQGATWASWSPLTLTLAPLTPPLEAPLKPLDVRGDLFAPIGIADLRPGDIGIDYRVERRNLRQRVIAAGEGMQDLFRRDRRGSPGFMHAFVVVQAYPTLGEVRVADASIEGSDEAVAKGQAKWGLDCSRLKLAEAHTKHAYHVFFRFKDPRMGLRMSTIARNWASQYGGNFRFLNAVGSVFRGGSGMSAATQARLLHLSKTAHLAGVMRNVDGSLCQIMCSEFVANVAACAAMSLYVDDHPSVQLGDPETLRALTAGPAGALCSVDPMSLSPAALAGRLAADGEVVKVGHLYAEA